MGLLVAGAVLVVVGVVSLVMGFVASSVWPIYLSVGCSLLAAPALITGVVLFVLDRQRPGSGEPGRVSARRHSSGY